MSLETLSTFIRENIEGFGPKSIISEKKSKSLARDLRSCRKQLSSIDRNLKVWREKYVAAQLKNLGHKPSDRNLRLHIGCGDIRVPQWINIGFYPAELSLNVNWGLPFATDSVDFIFCSHLIEHLYFPNEAITLLREFRRVLKKGGVLRVIVPDIGKCMEAYARKDRKFFLERQKTWSWTKSKRTLLEQFLGYAGAGVRPGKVGQHKYGYDLDTIKLVLREAGFTRVTKSHFMESRHKELLLDDLSTTAQAHCGGDYYSLFVEAT